MREIIAKIIYKESGGNDWIPESIYAKKCLLLADLILSALASQGEEGMLLTLDEIRDIQFPLDEDKLNSLSDEEATKEVLRVSSIYIAKAQLAKCQPLIEARARKEERERIMQKAKEDGWCYEIRNPNWPEDCGEKWIYVSIKDEDFKQEGR